ncbi:MAG: twin-arginine translocase TatA/TatE family subunit [Desulfobulbaceae bacterium]|nr:twin-arginine translocase TatA/TatE family subunit [Desulfobulbaceae bacterium]
MFGIGLPELILIMAVALIVVGPEKLPELAKGLAKQMLELKKAANVLKESLREDEPDKKDWDSDLPVGFSRPEQLAEAGRKASAINDSPAPAADESVDDYPDNEELAARPDDIEVESPAESGEADSADKEDPDPTAEKEEA